MLIMVAGPFSAPDAAGREANLARLNGAAVAVARQWPQSLPARMAAKEWRAILGHGPAHSHLRCQSVATGREGDVVKLPPGPAKVGAHGLSCVRGQGCHHGVACQRAVELQEIGAV